MRIQPSEAAFLAFLKTRLQTVALDFRDIERFYEQAMAQVCATFALNRSKYYRDGQTGSAILTVAHCSQCALIFYYLSRMAWLGGAVDIANRLYFLNCSQSSCDLFYEVGLPRRTHCDHPLGSVIGRGEFHPDGTLVFADGCGIGNSWSAYPEIEGVLVMSSQSAVIGRTRIRGTVILGRGANLVNAGVVQDCLVVGTGRDIVFKPLDPEKHAGLNPFSLA